MKKLLSLALCAAAATTFAADEITLGDEIGVIRVELADGQKNTIIAASFTDLAKDGKVSIANLIKTTNLEAGAQIIRYKADGTHEAWNLTAAGKWESAAATVTQDADGGTTTGTGDDPASATATVGEGLWIVRGATATPNAVIAIYGKYTANRTTEITAGAWNLVGNAGLKPYTFTGGTAGDKLIAVQNGARREYTHDGTKWTYSKHTTETVKFMGKDTVVAKETAVAENPTIAPGEGFWYHTGTAQTVSWKDAE